MALPSRRRLVVRAESAILRAIRQTEELGLTVVGAYDALYNADGVSWGDVRSRNPGPTITLTGSPTLSNGVLTFNGTDQYGRASNGRLGEITDGNGGIVLIHTSFTPGATAVDAVVGAGGASTVVAAVTTTAPVMQTLVSGTAPTTASAAQGANGVVRCQHAWRSGTAIGARNGAAAAVTATPGSFTATTASRLTIGASTADTPTNFAPLVVRTLVVVKGDYTAAAQAIWNQYAVLRGATV